MTNLQTLSPSEAKKLALLSQLLPAKSQRSKARKENKASEATLTVIEQLGYIQIDTISVVQRAHHHTLWSRNKRYQMGHIDQLTHERKIFEYWAHAAAYLPMKDYRFTLFRKQAFKNGSQRHWYQSDVALMEQVYSRIKAEGPLLAKDFEGSGYKNKGWGTKPAKRALECLFMQGDLMITERRNFHKVYDLTERVLPSAIDTRVPTDREYAQFLLTQYLTANGIGRLSQMTYLLKGIKPVVTVLINEMLEDRRLVSVNIKGDQYVMFPEALERLKNPLSRSKAAILSPFDNALIQRKRTKALFDFDYLLECYVPEAKRQFGYFCLPVLWNGELVARMDCKANRTTMTLEVRHLFVEAKLRKMDKFMSALEAELQQFATFNGCESFKILRVTSMSSAM
ncbi:hypothetical protein BCU70_21790 [Vibrio sp. 10N.286.49.C2]|uniref:winged helix-turn-helix domain-containing protein n=1 Tax=unclassified Vibrio TaxID=2614977 RepID=UPI000C839D4B|nr:MULTISPECIES: crosslink repair DNA glycosylase YcaQ family protein [unclassified Vibrio]PMH30332.1 hypothetical protein BCU70_21790 [Vibrio sp. 10N.286.49.C2]PMH50847.1 hypothetical protein BCU66_17960 [Vibrio sp. 10N.286.49.B1]PMH79559.1 hypothetical protein BCU58_04835 [Vibrio sp. 10N.286.48.B7]